MIKLLKTWQAIRPYNQNHIISSTYVNTMVTHRPASQNWMENVTSDCSVLQISASLCAQACTCSKYYQSEITGIPWPRHGTVASSQTVPSLVNRSLQKPTSMLLGKWQLPLTWYLKVHVTGTTVEYGPATEFLHFSTRKSIGKRSPHFF